MPAQDSIPVIRFTVTRFVVEGNNPLSAADTARVLEPFKGQHEGPEGVLAAVDALNEAIRARGFSFRRVVFPPQKLEHGVIKLRVVGFRLASVDVVGNRHYSEQNIRRSLPALKVGTIPSTTDLARALSLANEQPDKQLTVTFKEAEEADALAARVSVEDQKPWRLFANLNDTGNGQTGETRLTLGAQHNNLFGRDHALGVSYTTALAHYGDVKQWGVSYLAPLYRYHTAVSLFYVASDVNTGVVNGIDISGSGTFAGLHVAYTLPEYHSLTHKISLGIDDKLFDNRGLFNGTNLLQAVRSRPLTFQYTGSVQGRGWLSDYQLAYVRNISSGGGNDGAAYRANRAGADVTWDLIRADASIAYALTHGLALQARFAGQYSGEPLIPGEQMGFGGANSIRGFDEREVQSEDGVRGNIELWLPPLPYNARILGFVDGGLAVSEGPQPPGQSANDTLLSMGLGVRWNWRKNVSVAVDAARVLLGTKTRGTGVGRIHFNLLLSY